MSEFPEDHPITLLRGRRRPEPIDVRRWLEKQIVWLESRVRMDHIDGKRVSRFERELQMNAVVLEAYERECPVQVAKTDDESCDDGGVAPDSTPGEGAEP
jgi:hypothetical protein